MSIVEVSKMNYKASLQIMNVQASDGGIYRAVAKNKSGESTASINLNIAGGEEEERYVERYATCVMSLRLVIAPGSTRLYGGT